MFHGLLITFPLMENKFLFPFMYGTRFGILIKVLSQKMFTTAVPSGGILCLQSWMLNQFVAVAKFLLQRVSSSGYDSQEYGYNASGVILVHLVEILIEVYCIKQHEKPFCFYIVHVSVGCDARKASLLCLSLKFICQFCCHFLFLVF